MEPRSIVLACTAFIPQPDQRNDHKRCNFNCKRDPECTRAISCEILIVTQPSRQESHAQNKRNDNGEHASPPHGMKTGGDLSLRKAGIIESIE